MGEAPVADQTRLGRVVGGLDEQPAQSRLAATLAR